MKINQAAHRVGAKYGLVAAALNALAFGLYQLLGHEPYEALKFLNFILVPVFVFFSIRDFKRSQPGSELRLWQGLQVGLVAQLVLTVFSALFVFAYFQWLHPAALQEHIDLVLRTVQTNEQSYLESVGAQAYEDTLAQVTQIEAWTLAVDDLIRKTVTGLLFTLVFAVGLRS
ncbi:MAG: DUF4199 domain-containing protein [Cytophagales bacterium]|nr:DUF4199 domain-containing protein [Cytophagales bacterium]